MRKVLFGICLLTLLAFECERDIEFEDNQRLLLTAKLMNSQGTPMENIPVEVFATTQFGFNLEAAVRNDFGDVIGSGSSDEEGNVSITALKPLNASNIYALINFANTGFSGFKAGTAPLAYNFINDSDLEDNTFTIGNVVVDQIIRFEINITRSSNQTDTLQYNWVYNNGVKVIGDMDPYFYDGNSKQIGFNELLPVDQAKVETFNTIESDTIIFEYSLLNNGILATEQLEIIVNEQAGSFEFEF
jgi:hypothetical protein